MIKHIDKYSDKFIVFSLQNKHDLNFFDATQWNTSFRRFPDLIDEEIIRYILELKVLEDCADVKDMLFDSITLDEKFIDEYFLQYQQDILLTQPVSEKILRKYESELIWTEVVLNVNLTHEFIDEYFHKMAHCDIAYYQRLSEDIIDKYSEWLSWESVSMYQDLTEYLLEEYEEDVEFGNILHNQIEYNLFKKYEMKILRGAVDRYEV